MSFITSPLKMRGDKINQTRPTNDYAITLWISHIVISADWEISLHRNCSDMWLANLEMQCTHACWFFGVAQSAMLRRRSNELVSPPLCSAQGNKFIMQCSYLLHRIPSHSPGQSWDHDSQTEQRHKCDKMQWGRWRSRRRRGICKFSTRAFRSVV